MLGRKKKFIEQISFILDIVWGVILLFGIYVFLEHFENEWEQFLVYVTGFPFRIQSVTHLEDEWWWILVIMSNILLTLKLTNFYQLDLFASNVRIVFESSKSVLIGMGMTALFFNILSVGMVNRSLIFGFSSIFLFYLIFKEIIFRKYLINKYCNHSPLEALLVCSSSDIEKRLKDFNLRHLSTVIIKGIILSDDNQKDLPEKIKSSIVGNFNELGKNLCYGRYDLVFLGDARNDPEVAQKVLNTAEEQGIEVWYLADFFTPSLSKPNLDEYGGKPVIIFNTTSHYEGRLIVKRIFDVIITVLLFIVLSPLFILISLLIKISSKGSVFFYQERTGWRGRTFNLIKFRTMAFDAHRRKEEVDIHNEMQGPVFKFENDPRMTTIGKFLRRTSLDELPQLLNILKGEMSLVGPRPLPIYETKRFEAFKDHRRYSVLPGLTGLWQVSGRNRIKDFSEWVRLDLEYIDKWSLWLDISILVRTIPAVISGDGAK